MSVYSVNTLMEETRKVAANYYKLTGETLPVASELAKYDVMNIMHFEKPTKNESGVDLIGTGNWDKKRIQVKSRVIFPQQQTRPMVGQINPSGAWEYITLVLFDPDYFPGEILMLSRDEIEKGSSPLNTKNKRGSMSVARFRNIATSIWIRNYDEPGKQA